MIANIRLPSLNSIFLGAALAALLLVANCSGDFEKTGYMTAHTEASR